MIGTRPAPALVDTSAWFRSGHPRVIEDWVTRIEEDAIALCTPVRLEIGVSSRSREHRAALVEELASLPNVELDARACRRAEEVQDHLAARGHHRGPRPSDLLIAAIAEVNGLPVIHYDRHFDLIAQLTGQPMEWLAPRGTLD